MLLLHEYPPPSGDTLVPTREAPEIRGVPLEAGGEPAPPRRRPRIGWLVVAAAATFALGGAFWWLIDSRVPRGDYDDVVAQLQEGDADLTSLEAQYADLQTELLQVTSELTAERDDLATRVAQQRRDLDRLQQDLDSTTASNERLRASTVIEAERAEALLADKELLATGASDLADAVRALAYVHVNLHPEFVAEFIETGGDVSHLDALLVALGEDVTIQQWVDERDTWAVANRAVFAVGDDPLIDAWNRWNVAEPGSEREWLAWIDLDVHLDLLIVERANQLATID